MTVTTNVKKHMAELAEEGSYSDSVATKAAAREQSDVEKYFRGMSQNFMKLVCVALAVENAQLTDSLTAEDV